MREINLHPFYIGQRVAAVRDYNSHGIVLKKDQEYIIDGTGKHPCGDWYCTVGIKNPTGGVRCTKCDDAHMTTSGLMEFSTAQFVPIEHTFQSISLSKVLEEETKLISVN